MAYSIEKSRVAKGVGITLIVLLAACTDDQRYKRQVNGNEEYLKATPLQAPTSPSGMILPLKNGNYDIPAARRNGAVGKALDIRPPAQLLPLLHSDRLQYSGNSAVIQLEESVQSRNLWSQVAAVLKSKGYSIASAQDAQQRLNTDWIFLTRTAEDKQYRGRYQISLVTQDYQTFLQVTSLDLRQKDNPITNPALVQRYTVEILNSVVSGLQARNNELSNRPPQG
ncbi:MAG: outer membrane protein assembly factor BamC [Sodalis sp. (in: enterobacteria)]